MDFVTGNTLKESMILCFLQGVIQILQWLKSGLLTDLRFNRLLKFYFRMGNLEKNRNQVSTL